MNEHRLRKTVNQRTASLFRNGRNQAVRIPVEFELPGDEVLITEEDGRLIIEPKAPAKPDLFDELRRIGPLAPDERLPEIDDSGLPPPREVRL